MLTSVGRRYFDDNGKCKDDHGEYPGVVREVAKAQKVPRIDLHEQSWAMYSALGEAGTRPLFWSYQNGYYQENPVLPAKNDNTHFSEYGATRVAQLVVQDAQAQHLALASHLSHAAYVGKLMADLPVVVQTAFKKDAFDLAKYGGVAGGTVLVPRGRWLTGPITL